MVASLQPAGAVPDTVIDPDAAPGALLEQGLHLFDIDNNEAAARAFEAAIHTSRLNDAGRALAYWHIFVGRQRMNQVDASSQALYNFLVVAQQVIESKNRVRYAVSEKGDFIDRFDLPSKMDRGRAILSATWAERTKSFGRSSAQPVLVHNDAELGYFLEIVAPCSMATRRTVARRRVETDNGAPVHHVRLTCDETRESIEYYFEMPEAPQ